MTTETAKETEKELETIPAPLPLVAVVGQPNVGKSTLFNRLIGQRRSIVGDEPGITRDRIYGEAEWSGARFSIVDTGGIVPDDDAIIPANIFKQAGFAIDDAQAIIWVVDARLGLTPLDEELGKLCGLQGNECWWQRTNQSGHVWRRRLESFTGLGLKRSFQFRRSRGLGSAIC